MQECHTTDSNLWPKAVLKASLCIEGIPKYKYTGKECFYPSCTVQFFDEGYSNESISC